MRLEEAGGEVNESRPASELSWLTLMRVHTLIPTMFDMPWKGAVPFRR
jgi:hypothetical protein